VTEDTTSPGIVSRGRVVLTTFRYEKNQCVGAKSILKSKIEIGAFRNVNERCP